MIVRAKALVGAAKITSLAASAAKALQHISKLWQEPRLYVDLRGARCTERSRVVKIEAHEVILGAATIGQGGVLISAAAARFAAVGVTQGADNVVGHRLERSASHAGLWATLIVLQRGLYSSIMARNTLARRFLECHADGAAASQG